MSRFSCEPWECSLCKKVSTDKRGRSSGVCLSCLSKRGLSEMSLEKKLEHRIHCSESKVKKMSDDKEYRDEIYRRLSVAQERQLELVRTDEEYRHSKSIRQSIGVSESWSDECKRTNYIRCLQESRTNNLYEELAQSILDEYGIHYVRESRHTPSEFGLPYLRGRHGYTFDFEIDNRIDLEIDGSIHELPDRKVKDSLRNEYVVKNGYKVVRIVHHNDETKLRRLMTEFIGQYRCSRLPDILILE